MATVPSRTTDNSPGYQSVKGLLAQERCVILDGGVATEVERTWTGDLPPAAKHLWGTWALYRDPDAVAAVHRRYLDVGCNVISTNTWSILSAPEVEARGTLGQNGPTNWITAARRGVQLARGALRDAGRTNDCAVAFTISEEVTSPERQRTVELLTRVFEDNAPDLILLETLSLMRERTFSTVETLLATGIPVWLGFRRCLHGPCGVYGQHWGGPEGDLFGRAARRFEDMGVQALLINCLPVDHVPGILPWLRDFTDLPLGVYPNLGHLGSSGWRFDHRIGPDEYAELALRWREEEGAQIIGGCCGVTADHIAAARAAVLQDRPVTGAGPTWPSPGPAPVVRTGAVELPPEPARPWVDETGRVLYPLPLLPSLTCDEGVFAPTQGSWLMWRYLVRSGLGRGKRCLDVGCGCGVLAIQLALNGAERVDAIDIEGRAVVNTLANSFRTGVTDRVHGTEVDLYMWEPEENYDLIVASLYQMPVDPFEEYTGHRPVDFWGRNLLDQLFSLLPKVLAADGVAYVMQLSIISQQETAKALERLGLEGRVVDFALLPFTPVFQRNKAQIDRVEDLSDSYHITIGGEDLLVGYVLEVTRR